MSSADSIRQGLAALKKNPVLFAIPFIKYAIQAVVTCFAAFAFAVPLIYGWETASAAVFAILGLLLLGIALYFTGCFFEAALIGGCLSALNSQKVSLGKCVSWGREKGVEVFAANVLLIFTMAVLGLTFTPAYFAAIKGLNHAAVTFTLAALTVYSIASIFFFMLFRPLDYIIVTHDLGLSEVFQYSLDFFKKFAVGCLIIIFVQSAAYQVLNSLASLVTGPAWVVAQMTTDFASLNTQNMNAKASAATIGVMGVSALAFIVSNAVYETLSASWWTAYVRTRRE